jgi:hypothetical protein
MCVTDKNSLLAFTLSREYLTNIKHHIALSRTEHNLQYERVILSVLHRMRFTALQESRFYARQLT